MNHSLLKLSGLHGPIAIHRNKEGVAHVTALALEDIHFGLGFCHARDRGLQMLLTRIIGRGEASEKLRATDEMLDLDCFFRRLHLSGDTRAQISLFSKRAQAAAEAYCQGANSYFARVGIPWELRLLGCAFEPWTVADILLTAKIVGYVSLAQAQTEMERFLVKAIHYGTTRDQLEELFPGLLTGLDESLVRQVRLRDRLVPDGLQWTTHLPRMSASNNWVVAGRKTASGKPMFCNDPHLEVNRLPPVWYEAVLRWPTPKAKRYVIGATLPGVPGVIIGRTPDLAWGVTYAFMDCVDSWIENCRDGKFRRGDSWIPFAKRTEIVRRQKKPPVELTFYENDHGVLDGDPHQPGYYLATRWSCGENTGAASLDAACGILLAQMVEEGRHLLGRLSNSSWNWVLADRAGNIGYQMSGQMPRRRPGISGLVPLPGWDAANDWQGFESYENLPRGLNPPEGYFATANNNLNGWGLTHPINICMASYRADRIQAVLARESPITVETMKQLQLDLYSLQAERFMAIIRPLLEEFSGTHSAAVQLFKQWDLTYAITSQGAFLFEVFYRALIETVFGDLCTAILGRSFADKLFHDPAIMYDLNVDFDPVLLAEQSAWFGGRSRNDIYNAALAKALSTPPETLGKKRKLRMKHLLLGGKLPLIFGFDRLITLPGSRATVHQGQVFYSAGRVSTFAPSLRCIADLATDDLHTNLAGGVSDRRFSKWYANGIADWLHGRYKVLHGFD